MKRLPKNQLDKIVQHYFDEMISAYSLKNASKIALELRRKCIAETKRRKEIIK